MENFPVLIFLISRDGTFLDFKGSEDHLTLSPHKLIDKNVKDLTPKKVYNAVMSAIREVFEDHQPQYSEFTIPKGNNLYIFGILHHAVS